MHELVFLETFLLAKVLELPLVTDRGQEPFPAANILLTITAHLETLLVILQTHVGAKLFDVTTESGRNYISWWRKTEIETKGAEDNMNKWIPQPPKLTHRPVLTVLHRPSRIQSSSQDCYSIPDTVFTQTGGLYFFAARGTFWHPWLVFGQTALQIKA